MANLLPFRRVEAEARDFHKLFQTCSFEQIIEGNKEEKSKRKWKGKRCREHADVEREREREGIEERNLREHGKRFEMVVSVREL